MLWKHLDSHLMFLGISSTQSCLAGPNHFINHKMYCMEYSVMKKHCRWWLHLPHLRSFRHYFKMSIVDCPGLVWLAILACVDVRFCKKLRCCIRLPMVMSCICCLPRKELGSQGMLRVNFSFTKIYIALINKLKIAVGGWIFLVSWSGTNLYCQAFQLIMLW